MANRQEVDSIKVCVSLFGRASQYLTGAIACAQELHDLKKACCTDAELIIYYDATVPHGILARLKEESIVKLVYVDSQYAGKGTAGTFYRFFGFQEFSDSNAVVCTWDLDNKLNNGFAQYMIDMVIDGNAVFYMLKKDRLNRGRRYNADCWSAVPLRHRAFHLVANTLNLEMGRYLAETADYSYGCDERFQTQFGRHLLSLSSSSVRMLCSYHDSEVRSANGLTALYDTTQREMPDNATISKLESELARQKKLRTVTAQNMRAKSSVFRLRL